MAFEAQLTFDGESKPRKVLKLNSILDRSFTTEGMVSSNVKGGQIEITIESTGSTTLMEWMCDSYLKKNGKIEFYRVDQKSVLREINWTDGYCVKYEQSFDSNDETAMTETFIVSARVISCGNGVFENQWEAMEAS